MKNWFRERLSNSDLKSRGNKEKYWKFDYKNIFKYCMVQTTTKSKDKCQSPRKYLQHVCRQKVLSSNTQRTLKK